jgi:hypothetical protein
MLKYIHFSVSEPCFCKGLHLLVAHGCKQLLRPYSCHGHRVLNMRLRDLLREHKANSWRRFVKPRERNYTVAITIQDPVSAVCVRHIRHMEVHQPLVPSWDFPQRDGAAVKMKIAQS